MSVDVELAHAVPGRVRLRAPLIVGRPAVAERIVAALQREGSTRVTARTMTGSVVVEGEALDPDRLLERLRALLAAERDERGRPLEAPRPQAPGPVRIAHTIAHAFLELNGDVRRGLGGDADLGTLLPVVFAGLGFIELARARTLPTPSWFNLLWWSVRSYMIFNPGAVDEEVKADDVAHGAAVRAAVIHG